jgi:flavin-binding protein dodecin
VAEYTGTSPHSFEAAVHDAAKQVPGKATFKVKGWSGDISPNPGQINKFEVVIETA